MESRDDNKVKSITFLVRSLIVVTMLSLALVFALLCYAFSEKEVIYPQCGVIDPVQKTIPICGTGMQNCVVNGHDGKQLFKANCSSCHSFNAGSDCGPGFRGIVDRIPGGDWKYQFVRDHDGMVASGDVYAVFIYKQWNWKSTVPKFQNLTEDEIDAILCTAN